MKLMATHKRSKLWIVTTVSIALWIGFTVPRGYSEPRPQRGAIDAEPAFEVVSIRVNTNRDPMGMRWRPDGGVTITNTMANYLVQLALPDVRGDLVGLPDWARSTRLDVSATVVPGRQQPNAAQRATMILSMLVDRFNFKWHLETRVVPTYDLVLDSKGTLGRGMSRSDKDCAALEAARRNAIERARSEGTAPPGNSSMPSCIFRQTGNRFEGDLPIELLAPLLRGLAGRLVIDKTGLTGSYRFMFEAGAAERDDREPTIDGTSVVSV